MLQGRKLNWQYTFTLDEIKSIFCISLSIEVWQIDISLVALATTFLCFTWRTQLIKKKKIQAWPLVTLFSTFTKHAGSKKQALRKLCEEKLQRKERGQEVMPACHASLQLRFVTRIWGHHDWLRVPSEIMWIFGSYMWSL
jgi:hypothetical protein